MSVASAPRGRPRSEAVDRAIVEATVACLARDGYQRLTLSAVAEEAGVSRPAIYRRYRSRAALAAAALVTLSEGPPIELPAEPGPALRALLGATATALASPGAMTLLGSLLAQERRDPGLLEAFRLAVFRPRHGVVRDLLRAAKASGQVTPGADEEVVIDLLFGALLARAMAGEELEPGYLDRVVDTVWSAISTA